MLHPKPDTAASDRFQGPSHSGCGDVFWDKGSKLSKYSIRKEEMSGLSARFTVKLTLADKAGEARERIVNYNADSGKRFVIRPDF